MSIEHLIKRCVDELRGLDEDASYQLFMFLCNMRTPECAKMNMKDQCERCRGLSSLATLVMIVCDIPVSAAYLASIFPNEMKN